MHAIPGELLTTTELVEDPDYNPLWKVPFGWQGVKLLYGDLLMTVACWHEEDKSPALLLHLRCNKILSFEDIEDVGWLWRPSDEIDKLREEFKHPHVPTR